MNVVSTVQRKFCASHTSCIASTAEIDDPESKDGCDGPRYRECGSDQFGRGAGIPSIMLHGE